MGSRERSTVLALLFALLAGCAGRAAPSAPRVPSSPAPLRVGVTTSSPPFALRQGSEVVGLEVDFARALADGLGRPLELRTLEWEDQIPALVAGRIDIVMSGMTITPARQVRIAFSDAYLESGLIGMVRRGDSSRYRTARSVLESRGVVGVVSGTTGERFVRERAPGAQVGVYPTAGAAVAELVQGRADAVVHDAPVLLWFAGSREADLAPVIEPLNHEQLGWGLRQADGELRAAVNGALARWRGDGTRERILSRWVPYWTRLEASVRGR